MLAIIAKYMIMHREVEHRNIRFVVHESETKYIEAKQKLREILCRLEHEDHTTINA